MRLLADENVDGPIVERLRNDGHDVLWVAELEPAIPDEQVLDLANRESSLLLTADTDFGELVYRQRRIALGVVLIRLTGLSSPRKAALVADALRSRGAEMPGGFTVITPGAVRIRKRS